MDMNRYRLIIFDADGTLRRCTVPGQPCPNAPEQWELLPGVKEKLQERVAGWEPGQRGYTAIVSNQGGVGLGRLTCDMALSLLHDLSAAILSPAQRRYHNVYLCTHAPSAGCICRKPSPFMLYRAMDEAHSIPRNTLYVGDMESDREAAQRAGVAFQWAWKFFGWPDPDLPKQESADPPAAWQARETPSLEIVVERINAQVGEARRVVGPGMVLEVHPDAAAELSGPSTLVVIPPGEMAMPRKKGV